MMFIILNKYKVYIDLEKRMILSCFEIFNGIRKGTMLGGSDWDPPNIEKEWVS